MELERIAEPERLDPIYKLRALAWQSVRPGAFASGRWKDEHDDHAAHWAIVVEGKIVAAARLCIHHRIDELPDAHFFEGSKVDAALPVGSLNRLVVHPEMRRRGFSAPLDDVRLGWAALSGCRSVLCCTENEHRIRSLKNRGFQMWGPANNVDPKAVARGMRPMVLAKRIEGPRLPGPPKGKP